MPRDAVNETLDQVITAVAQIDAECRTLLGKVEHGLANVKLEFRDKAYEAIGKQLTEETLIAWLVHKKLRRLGHKVAWEVPYPDNRRRKCDLVFDLSADRQLWLELKLAWKAWSNCEGDPVYKNGFYLSYLKGNVGLRRTHSFGHDFEKLSAESSLQSHYRAICLIGFDWANEPMVTEVFDAVKSARKKHGRWLTSSAKTWPDRRNEEFRINVWSWVLLPSKLPVPLRTKGRTSRSD